MIDIVRPLDEVQIHGELPLTPEQYGTIMNEVVRGTRRSKDSRKVFHFLSSHPVHRGVNTVHLDVMRLPSHRAAGGGRRTLTVSLAQEWFPSASSERVPSKIQSDKDAERIEAILDILDKHSQPTTLICHVDWIFREVEAEPFIPIPFPIFSVALVSELDMPNVQGLRIASEDNTRTASLERLASGQLMVNISLQLPEAKVSVTNITQVIQEANKILSGLVRAKSTGGSE